MKSLEQRFVDSITIKGNGCWLWKQGKIKSYATFRFNNKYYYWHRWIYEKCNGPIPDGLEVDHLCRRRACVNPTHLEVVTARINTLRGDGPSAINARKTHCCRGHLLSVENVYLWKRSRHCRKCNLRAQLKIYHRKKQ